MATTFSLMSVVTVYFSYCGPTPFPCPRIEDKLHFQLKMVPNKHSPNKIELQELSIIYLIKHSFLVNVYVMKQNY